MDPTIWGPHGWIFLHSITYNYPENPSEDVQKAAINFFSNLDKLLPCDICKTNYSNHLQTYPIEENVTSREKLMKWLIDIHNEVNIILCKPISTYDSIQNV